MFGRFLMANTLQSTPSSGIFCELFSSYQDKWVITEPSGNFRLPGPGKNWNSFWWDHIYQFHELTLRLASKLQILFSFGQKACYLFRQCSIIAITFSRHSDLQIKNEYVLKNLTGTTLWFEWISLKVLSSLAEKSLLYNLCVQGPRMCNEIIV